MSTISALITLALSLYVVGWILSLIHCLLRSAKEKEPIQKKDLLFLADTIQENPVISSVIILGILIVFLYNNATFTQLVGIEKPLSKRVEGTYCYYVDAYEENTKKKYTIPAEIKVEHWVDEDDDGRSRGGVNYYIERLFFDDGRIAVLESYYDASFKYATWYNDINGDNWKCQLTEKHAYSSYMEETSFINTQDLVELVVIIVVVMINWLGGLSLALKPKKQLPEL